MDLQQFCHPSRGGGKMSSPFSAGDYSYATNGHLIIRVPRVDDIPERDNAPGIGPLVWKHNDIADWHDLPEYESPPAKTCVACDGSGYTEDCPECEGDGNVFFSNDHNEYSFDCKTCDGEGVEPSNEEDGELCEDCAGTGEIKHDTIPITWGKGYINAVLMEQIKDLPGLKLSDQGDGLTPWHFRFDGGEGLVMPCFNNGPWERL